MNLFSGMDKDQIISVFLTVGVFTFYAILISISLVAFYVTSKPRNGRVRTAAAWHLLALMWFCWDVTSTVWGSPAEKSFFTSSDYTGKMVIWGGIFVVLGIASLLMGFWVGARQKRRWQQEALLNQ